MTDIADAPPPVSEARLAVRTWLPFATALLIYAALSFGLLTDIAAAVNDSKLNVFVLAAAIASLHLLTPSPSERLSGVGDEAAAVLVVAGLAAGYAGAAASLFGVFLASTAPRGSYRFAGGVVMLAVCLRVIWAPMILQAIAPVILPVDAHLAYQIVAMQNAAATLAGTVILSSDDFGIDVREACSSFHNVSLASLAVVTIAMVSRRRFVARDLVVLIAIATIQVALNVARLSLMAPDLSAFTFWHDGLGKQGMAALGAFLMLSIASLGVSWATKTSNVEGPTARARAEMPSNDR